MFSALFMSYYRFISFVIGFDPSFPNTDCSEIWRKLSNFTNKNIQISIKIIYFSRFGTGIKSLTAMELPVIRLHNNPSWSRAKVVCTSSCYVLKLAVNFTVIKDLF